MTCPSILARALVHEAAVISRRLPRLGWLLEWGERWMWFVGDDWAEDHHDVEVQDQSGRRLARARLLEGVAGIARLHELIAGLVARTPRRVRCWWVSRPIGGRGWPRWSDRKSVV